MRALHAGELETLVGVVWSKGLYLFIYDQLRNKQKACILSASQTNHIKAIDMVKKWLFLTDV